MKINEKQGKKPPISQTSERTSNKMESWYYVQLHEWFFLLLFKQAIWVLLHWSHQGITGGGMWRDGESNLLNTQALNTIGLVRNKTIPRLLSEKCWWYAFMLKINSPNFRHKYFILKKKKSEFLPCRKNCWITLKWPRRKRFLTFSSHQFQVKNKIHCFQRSCPI